MWAPVSGRAPSQCHLKGKGFIKSIECWAKPGKHNGLRNVGQIGAVEKILPQQYCLGGRGIGNAFLNPTQERGFINYRWLINGGKRFCLFSEQTDLPI